MIGPDAQTVEGTKEKLLLDGLRRLETHSPMYVLPRLILSQHLHSMLLGLKRRLADSHRYQMKLLGEKVGDDPDEGISLKGDTTIYNTGSRLLPWLLSAAMLGAGALAGKLLSDKPTQSPPVVEVPAPPTAPPVSVQDWKLGVKVTAQP